jgi:hypothetical protein
MNWYYSDMTSGLSRSGSSNAQALRRATLVSISPCFQAIDLIIKLGPSFLCPSFAQEEPMSDE